MRVLGTTVLLIMCACAGSAAERPSSHTWIRRATLAASCAASLVFDTYSTRAAVSAGAVEANSLLAGQQGRPRWGLMFGLKAANCAVSAVLQESHLFKKPGSEISDWKWTAINTASAGAYTWIGFHNLALSAQHAVAPDSAVRELMKPCQLQTERQ